MSDSSVSTVAPSLNLTVYSYSTATTASPDLPPPNHRPQFPCNLLQLPKNLSPAAQFTMNSSIFWNFAAHLHHSSESFSTSPCSVQKHLSTSQLQTGIFFYKLISTIDSTTEGLSPPCNPYTSATSHIPFS